MWSACLSRDQNRAKKIKYQVCQYSVLEFVSWACLQRCRQIIGDNATIEAYNTSPCLPRRRRNGNGTQPMCKRRLTLSLAASFALSSSFSSYVCFRILLMPPCERCAVLLVESYNRVNNLLSGRSTLSTQVGVARLRHGFGHSQKARLPANNTDVVEGDHPSPSCREDRKQVPQRPPAARCRTNAG